MNYRKKEFLRRTLSAALVIGSALGFVAYSAHALQVDQNRNFPARLSSTQQTNYARFTVNFNDQNIGAGQKFIALPNNAYINRMTCQVLTTFNAGTTNVFTVGSVGSGFADLINNGGGTTRSVNVTSAGYYDITHNSSVGTQVTSGGDVTLGAKYTQTGTAATQGAVTCMIEFIPNNDN